jgi:hypothetical protein
MLLARLNSASIRALMHALHFVSIPVAFQRPCVEETLQNLPIPVYTTMAGLNPNSQARGKAVGAAKSPQAAAIGMRVPVLGLWKTKLYC